MLNPDIQAVLDGSAPYHIEQGIGLDVMRDMPSGCLDALITDPPYSTTGEASSYVTKSVPVETQFYEAWIREQLREWVRVLKPTGVIWMTLDWHGALALESACVRLGQRKPKIGVWDRGGLGMGYLMRNCYENFVIVPMVEFKRFRADEPDVWSIKWTPGMRRSGHSAEKPVELFQRACNLIVPPNGIVFDPFAGSGSSALAARNAGLRYIGVEREPEYVEIMQRRLDGTFQEGEIELPGTAPTHEEDDGASLLDLFAIA